MSRPVGGTHLRGCGAAPFWTATSQAGCLSVVAMLPEKSQPKRGVLQVEHGSTFNAPSPIMTNALEGSNTL